MKKTCTLLVLITGTIVCFISCSKSESAGGGGAPAFCDGVNSKYSTDVQPIINTSCLLGSNCHSAGSTNTGGELTDYNKVFNQRFNIRAAVNAGTMPQTGSLTLDQKKKIICWIDGGAPNN